MARRPNPLTKGKLPMTILPRDFTEPIGRVAVYYTVLEEEVLSGIRRLLDLVGEVRFEIIMAYIQNMEPRLQFLQSLAKERIEDNVIYKEFAEIIRLAREVSRKRNNVLHNPWFMYSWSITPERTSGKAIKHRRTRKGLEESSFSKQDIRNVATECRECALAFRKFWKNHPLDTL